MRDLNFNPGIGLRKPLFSGGRYIGSATLILEHESNGRDSLESRSWNRLSLSANILLDPQVMVHGKLWIPYVDGLQNRDLLRYVGVMQGGFTYQTPNQRWVVSCILNKRWGWNFSLNTTLEVSWRPWRQTNQYLFAQYYNGYGECLLDYKVFRSQLRVGFVIKPRFFSDF
jgi:phospholipase A1